MAKVNRHSLRLIGLRRASGETYPCGFPSRVDVFYDRFTGEVFTQWHSCENSWSEFASSNFVFVCSTRVHLTMQEIADKVYARLLEINMAEGYAI